LLILERRLLSVTWLRPPSREPAILDGTGLANPPDAMRGKFFRVGEPEARAWLTRELDRVFPKAEALIRRMEFDVRYKDVTFETLNQEDFLDAVKGAFPNVNWDKAYSEFRVAGESTGRRG
jgi:hypothetical protein